MAAAVAASEPSPSTASPAVPLPEFPDTIETKLDDTTLQAIRDLTQQMASRPTAPPSAPAEFAAPPPDFVPAQLEDGADASKPSAEPYQIKVVNKIPSTFLYVMKEQFTLMKGWMEPLTRITADQDEQLKKLESSMQDIIARYDDMIDRLEKKRPVDDDPADESG